MPHMEIVTAGIPDNDGCPILTRIKAFIVYEGTIPTLEHVFRDRNGKPVNLACDDVVQVSESASESASASASASASVSASQSSETPFPAGEVILRVTEFIGGIRPPKRKLHSMAGTVVDAAAGVVRCSLNSDITRRAGIYQLSWGLHCDGQIKFVNEGLLSVERSLFGDGVESPAHISGPPTINEIRMQMMDSSGAENLLLDDVEFDDETIALAITKPVMEFNEVPPPLCRQYTTQDFPWKSHWMDAIIGYLHQFAAAHYRRNRLGTQAGGVTVDDKNKETEYLRAAAMYLSRWRDFLVNKKVEINMKAAVGSVGSTYGYLGGGR